MNRPSENIRELEEAISEFIVSFELVFDNDWDMTKDRIIDPDYIDDKGTFIHPNITDEGNNWGNRGSLLYSYRHLLELLKKHNIPHSIDSMYPDENEV